VEKYVKRESRGINERHFILEGRRESFLEASPARPSKTGSVKEKTLGWLEAMARDKGGGIFYFPNSW
jgi:hypothetical protein